MKELILKVSSLTKPEFNFHLYISNVSLKFSKNFFHSLQCETAYLKVHLFGAFR